MAANASTEDWHARLERSGLLPSDTLAQAFADGADSKVVVDRLVADRLLTPFQVRQIEAGRCDGFVLGEKYKLLDFVGQGGMGKVYLCEHLLLHRLVAIKLLQHPAGTDSQTAARSLDRFYREARAVAALDDINIVHLYDIDRATVGPFMVLEYVDGTNLHEIVTKHGPLPPDRAANSIRQAARGLQHAFAVGLIHRDIKPGNLLLDRAGVIKVLDLGLARFVQDPGRNQAITAQYDRQIVIGTVDFMAPEQVTDNAAADIRSDIYALGCTLYFLLTGRVPFPNQSVPHKMLAHQSQSPEPVSELAPHVPRGLLDVLDRMIAKDPAERFPTPADVDRALAEWGPDKVPPPRDVEMPERPASFYRLGLTPHLLASGAFVVTPQPGSGAETLSVLGAPNAWSIPRNGRPSDFDSVPTIKLSPPTAKRRPKKSLIAAELFIFVLLAGIAGIVVAGLDRKKADLNPIPQARSLGGPVVTAGGSTYIAPVMNRWAGAYAVTHGGRIDYQGVGSPMGVQRVIDRVYVLGCTHAPLSDDQLAEARRRGGEIVHVPLALAAVAVTYNLPDSVTALRLSGEVLADIYLGNVTRWNDPALTALNPNVKLPDLPITVINRLDPSGTSHNWTEYLSKYSAAWREAVGTSATPTWPIGQGAASDGGMADMVLRTPGAIGFAESNYALASGLRVAQVRNRHGQFATPTATSVTAAADGALRSVPDDFRFSLIDAPGAEAYPISTAVWAVLFSDLRDRSAGRDAVDFLRWAIHEGQDQLADVNLAPLPKALTDRVDQRLNSIRFTASPDVR